MLNLKSLALVFFLFGSNLHAKEWVFAKSKNNSVEFNASGNPGFIRIAGSGAFLSGNVFGDNKGFSAKFSVFIDDFKTGIELRDKHLKEKYLETKKYPYAILAVENLSGFKEGESFPWQGKLTLKNNTKPVNGVATVKGNTLSAKFKISLADYPEIGIPSYLGVTVAETIEISVDAEAK